MPFQPVETQRLYERIAAQIGDLIRSGEFSEGQRLPAERDLAKLLAVSRPVVREAMIALEVEGLVEVRGGSGAYVREKPPEPKIFVNAGDSPSDILNARILVETKIAELAAKQASELALQTIAARIAEMERDHETGRSWRDADLGFHVAIALATGNVALAGVVEWLWRQQHGAVFSLLSERVRLSENWSATVEGHRRILEALQAREPKAAKAAMRAHLSQVLEVMTGD